MNWTTWPARNRNGVTIAATAGIVTVTMVRNGEAISTVGIPLDPHVAQILASAIAVARGK